MMEQLSFADAKEKLIVYFVHLWATPFFSISFSLLLIHVLLLKIDWVPWCDFRLTFPFKFLSYIFSVSVFYFWQQVGRLNCDDQTESDPLV